MMEVTEEGLEGRFWKFPVSWSYVYALNTDGWRLIPGMCQKAGYMWTSLLDKLIYAVNGVKSSPISHKFPVKMSHLLSAVV